LPLLDIEVDDGISDETVHRDSAEQQSTEPAPQTVQTEEKNDPSAAAPVSKNNGIMTPAVRHLLKEHNLSAEDIQATGKGGRILKEDVQRHLAEPQQSPPPTPPLKAVVPASIEDQRIRLTPIQSSMSKIMTASLSIPHFLYTHAVDVTGLNSIRRRLNTQQNLLTTGDGLTPNITSLPIILKALSHTLGQFPITNGSHKELLLKGSHDFGIAMDTPSDLLVPVVRNVQNHTIVSLAAEVERLGKLAKDGRLAPGDLTGATLMVSNIGSIGGDVVSPVIVPPQVGIVVLGRVQDVPVFEKDDSLEQRMWLRRRR
jgi:2-oxoisovalerate dehydrogenase E2 component (dihydrolipoyl transacylase)